MTLSLCACICPLLLACASVSFSVSLSLSLSLSLSVTLSVSVCLRLVLTVCQDRRLVGESDWEIIMAPVCVILSLGLWSSISGPLESGVPGRALGVGW